MNTHSHLPDEICTKLKKARRLEWWTVFFLITIVIIMYFAVGSSQAMKSAWAEDMLSLLPPLLFLLSERVERRAPTRRFPYGFHRVGSLAFFASACALTAMGLFLLYEAGRTLAIADHPTIGTVSLFGHQVWLGWLMIAALTYSVIPPVILGRMKKPLARDLNDKILFTDANMNSADWRTGVAGIVGILGIAYGFWWADAVAAGLISFSILKDGVRNCRIATAELVDGAPRAVDSARISEEAEGLRERLEADHPGHLAQIRETGRYMRALLVPRERPTLDPATARKFMAKDEWRLLEVGRADHPPQRSSSTSPSAGRTRQAARPSSD